VKKAARADERLHPLQHVKGTLLEGGEVDHEQAVAKFAGEGVKRASKETLLDR